MSAVRRGLPSGTWQRIVARDGGRCRHCHRSIKGNRIGEIDHIIEVADGGGDDDDNLQLLCVPCHQRKTTASARDRRRPPALWLRSAFAAACIVGSVGSLAGEPSVALGAGMAFTVSALVWVCRWVAWRRRMSATRARLAARWSRTDVVATPAGVRARTPIETALDALTGGEVTVHPHHDHKTVVDYPGRFRDHDDGQRAEFVDVWQAKAGGRWRATWDTQTNRVTLEKRPPMPTRIDRPYGPGSTTAIPFATDEDGEVLIWRPDTTPHMLVSGDTGSGKSVLLRGVASTCHEAGWVVSGVDPKRIELSPLRSQGIPVATNVDDMILAVEAAYTEMMDRYTAIESGDVSRETLMPYLLIVDEAMIWVQAMTTQWNTVGKAAVKGTGTSHPVIQQWQQIVILGRSARVFLLTGIQRPDAALLGKDGGGATRDQYGVRVAMGPMKADGLRMLFGRSDIGRDVPTEIKGRATVAMGNAGQPAEAQVWYTP